MFKKKKENCNLQHMPDVITDRDATSSVFFRFFKSCTKNGNSRLCYWNGILFCEENIMTCLGLKSQSEGSWGMSVLTRNLTWAWVQRLQTYLWLRRQWLAPTSVIHHGEGLIYYVTLPLSPVSFPDLMEKRSKQMRQSVRWLRSGSLPGDLALRRGTPRPWTLIWL